MKSLMSFFLLLTLVIGLTSVRAERSHAAVSFQAGAKILADEKDANLRASLQASGAQQLVDYGAFSLWKLPSSSSLALRERTGSQEPLDDSIYLRGITLHPGAAAQPLPPALSTAEAQADGEGEGLWLVQFIGPTLPDWLATLQAAGLEIVSYVPNNAYLVWGRQPAAALDSIATSADASGTQVIQWTGAYHPLYRLEPSLRAPADRALVDVSVQFYTTSRLPASLQALSRLAVQEYQPPADLLNTTVVRVQIPAQALAELASWPDVINIEPYLAPELLDEIQGQILAGNVISQAGLLVAAQPGYLQWLASKGFPQEPDAYPLVDVVDDGLDSGFATNILHPDFYELGQTSRPDRIAYIHNCTGNPFANAVGGHGQLNAGILAGYNNLLGFPYQDAQGYRRGLGVSPYGRIAATKVFDNNGFFSVVLCGSSYASFVDRAYANGARITSNSWGASVAGVYNIDAQAYDMLTRDASPQAGNQEMLHIFAAGNDGPTSQSIGSPGSAKNVLTVGAIENVRDEGINDGCLISTGNNADDIAGFSSRGPTRDGRIKPDILAPGTHVQAQASLDSGFTGSSICGGYTGTGTVPHYPLDQRLYTWSSGTSHAAPAISGVAQLTYNYYQRVLKPGAVPSPAMLKALILNTPRYLNGAFASDALPSASQGWGSADMGKIFDGTRRMLFDQQQIFDKSGQTFEVNGHVVTSSKPFHVSLVWTDAPGAPFVNPALVNNLDLEVIVDGETFRGNVFNGAYTMFGGSADSRNNIENVFLPAGVSGEFRVRVIARSLNGDGVPNNNSLLDQDFALVIYNGGVSQDFRHWVPMIVQ